MSFFAKYVMPIWSPWIIAIEVPKIHLHWNELISRMQKENQFERTIEIVCTWNSYVEHLFGSRLCEFRIYRLQCSRMSRRRNTNQFLFEVSFIVIVVYCFDGVFLTCSVKSIIRWFRRIEFCVNGMFKWLWTDIWCHNLRLQMITNIYRHRHMDSTVKWLQCHSVWFITCWNRFPLRMVIMHSKSHHIFIFQLAVKSGKTTQLLI